MHSKEFAKYVLCLALVLWISAIVLGWDWPSIWMRYDKELIRVAGSLLSVLGAVSLWLLKVRNDRRTEDARRAARQRRLLAALRSEIEMQLETYFDQFGPDVIVDLRRRLINRIETNPAESSMPTGVVPKENDVFDRVKDEIADLPVDTIGPIIRYYQADEYAVELMKAFADKKFVSNEKDQRLALVKSYVDLCLSATILGCDAITALSMELKEQDSETAKSALTKKERLATFQRDVTKYGWKP